MQSLRWSPLCWESKNQISLQVPQKRFHAHSCLDGYSGIDDWNFLIFEQCETHEQLKERESF